MGVIEFLRKGLESISAGSSEEMSAIFSEDCCFQVPSGPYRIDSVAEYVDVVSRHATLGGVLEYLHIRQPLVKQFGDTEVVAFNWVSRSSLDGVVASGVGYGTAIIAGGKIQHLHITRYAPSPGTRVHTAAGERFVGDDTRQDLLNQLLWSDSPEVTA